MRILIVDDSIEKIRRLVEHLTNACGLDRERDILVAQCAYEARKILEKESVDLVLLDILLPMRPEDTPSQQTSVALLKEITERKTLKRPKQIVGLTAYKHIAKEVGPYFSERQWSLVTYDRSSDEWLQRIEAC